MAAAARAVLRRAADRMPGLASAYRRMRGPGSDFMAAARSAFAAEVVRLMRAREAPRVAFLPGRGWRIRDQLQEGCPQARIFRVPTEEPEATQHAFLAAHGPFDLVVDATRPRRPARQLDRLFGHVRAGGALVVRALPAAAGPGPEPAEGAAGYLARLRETARQEPPPADAPRWRRARHVLGRSIDTVREGPGYLVVTSRQGALAKLREHEANLLIGFRDSDRTRLLELRPAPGLVSRCTLRENIPRHQRNMASHYQAPDAALREYADALCANGQVVAQGNLLLPDTYRHHPQRWLNNQKTQEVAPRFARIVADTSQAPRLSGTYFHIDSELPGHYGHTVTEQVARLWGWPAAKRIYPDLKALVGLRPGNSTITEAERRLFAAIGIGEEDVVTMPGPVVVERLVAATPMLSMPHYVNPDIAETWGVLGDRLAADTARRDFPPKFFCSRRIAKRACRNAEVVEAMFAEAGFEIVFPEDYPLPEQVQMFRQAEVVAGFAGSALFTLMFVPTPKRVLMVSSESYTATNEYLIASVLGHGIDLVWCPSDIRQPESGWSKEAFESSFVFDVDRDGAYLKELLAST